MFTVRVPVELLGGIRELAMFRRQSVSDVARDAFEREIQVQAHDLRGYWRELRQAREDLQLRDQIDWIERLMVLGRPASESAPMMREWLARVEEFEVA